MLSRLRRRLLPLYVATMLQGFMLWLPIEKLFMSEIGFDAASVGVMAAAYAAAVPMVEVLSGVLADRWSRRGVLVLSSVALVVSNVIGGVSNDVVTYIVSAMVLGVYFAMYTGTMDAIVYDTVLEETGGSGDFERRIGRVRLLEAIALATSSVLGGWIAGLTATRVTYFLTIPFAVLSIIAYLRFREPLLHKAGEATSLREHLAVTFRTLTRQRVLLPIIALAVLSSLILQVMFEFGPLWMVALAVPAVLYGPYWAGLVSTLGIGGLLAGRIRLDRPGPIAVAVGVTVAAALVLPMHAGVAVVIIAQITLALLMVIAGIYVTRLLHDAVPSTVRTGVASGVSALSWIVFLPFALVFGVVSRDHGVRPASWMIIAVAVLAGILLAVVARPFGPSEPAPSGIDLPQERNNLAPALRE